jgi:hypothetical protein
MSAFNDPIRPHRVYDASTPAAPSCSWWAAERVQRSRDHFRIVAEAEYERMKGSKGAQWAQALQSDGAEAWAIRRRV